MGEPIENRQATGVSELTPTIQSSIQLSVKTEPVLAAIDLGTNSVHMVVVKIKPDLPAFTIVARQKESVRLGDRDLQTGNLKPSAIQRAIDALRRFQTIAESLNVDRILAVATSATREAPNGRAFLDRIESELGLQVNLISGQEEARRIYLGILSGIEFHNLPHVAIDIGGGSTELILGDGHEPRTLSSTKIGAVRLTSEFITTDPISAEQFQYLRAYIRIMLEHPIDELQSHLSLGEKPKLVGTSGTIESLAQIHAAQKTGTLPTRLHGYEFTLEDVRAIVRRLRKLTSAERAKIPGLSERRSDIIIAGALILQEAMSLLGIESLTVCERSLREGSIVDWMLTQGTIEDRLSYQSSVRERNTLLIAQKYQVNLQHTQQVAQFALGLFDATQGQLHHWQTSDRRLLWAAAILHNCGIYVSHSAHHKHSYYLIRYGELLGYTETEIELIANIARYHRKSPPKKQHEPYNSLPRLQQQAIEQLSAMLRLAVALDFRQIGAIDRIYYDYQANVKTLSLMLIPARDDDACELELWNLNYSKDVFEGLFCVRVIAKLSV
jgi:exopolyphosphatase / guanosine-5'-triphosphate,3'-diphosphate pyrophosphatase